MSDLFQVPRTGLGPLEFNGVRLASASTANRVKPRWTEFELYRTDGGKYVTVVIGQTTLAHEEAIYTVKVHKTAEAACKSFIHRETGRLSFAAIDLLESAADVDAAIDEVMDDLNEVQRIN